ncbi:uncharacterized protein LOC117586052 [Drosophila guanche]|uniref:Blast:Zinc finger protein 442 n=1 Tax=Drosophila guanche TaxID=7266 RepID=A0A3B0JPV8_DROGU|nr:uncharacterized protein LOC117586052 [Drosophila guanche]SPP84247.1 blast:Zinc finger protein 442 [Drosophila guanche]
MSRSVMLTDEQSRLNARLEAHMVYICPECGKAFRTQAEWRQHLNTKHDYLKKTYTDFNFIQIDERYHECQICFKWVENAHKTIALLQYHYFMHLEHSETYRCVHCRMAYTRRRALNGHLLDTHMREIEKYETKLRQMKRTQNHKATPTALQAASERVTPKRRGRPPGTGRKRNDLLQKALMDIDLQADEDKSSQAKPNVSEVNLDRCLTAYEDIVRKEEEQKPKYEADLDALCKEFFDDPDAAAAEEKDEKNQEMVIIEIDALGKDEVAQLKKDMHTDPETSFSASNVKRRRMSTSPTRDSDTEVSTNGLMKLLSFLCPKCGKEVHSMDVWREHVFEKHDFEHFIENSFKILEPGRKSKCLQCQEIQPSTKRSELQKHFFKHMPYRSYLKCTICHRTKTSMSKMFNHIRYNHQTELQRKNKTQLLIKTEPKSQSPNHNRYSVKGEKQEDEEASDDGEALHCDHCQKSYKSQRRYQRHLAMCTRSSSGTMRSATPIQAGVDALMNHLREGRMRMHDIWKTMQLQKL